MQLPLFGFVTLHRDPLRDGTHCEAEWMEGCAASGRAVAHLWHAPAGFVVPRRYTALPGWKSLPSHLAAAVHVRASGGGLVPQGPGVWNLSLIWPAGSATPNDTGAIYAAFCDALAAAFARLGIHAAPQAVEGSFCDGRYNLAVQGRKLVGTAQAWRRVNGRPVVLAHAVIVVNADPEEITARANDFERALCTTTRYRADSLTSVAREARADAREPPDLERWVIAVLAEQFARMVPPRSLAQTIAGPGDVGPSV
ncbi:MAG TPA: lipoate--protein ligase [Burkholderiaceae bacterium]|nr:lipoate--protein ligase [Burkholderiaceae bacterium]